MPVTDTLRECHRLRKHLRELQAEIDKYIASLWLLRSQNPRRFPVELHHLLFERARVDTELARERTAIYRRANDYAARFCGRLARTLATALLDLLLLKPIAIFVWWFSTRKNRMHFEQRRELRRRVDRALAAGRPVILASNHVSWFDDPVIPMALYRTGERVLVLVDRKAVRDMLNALVDRVGPAGVTDLRVQGPSLEDVYLGLGGEQRLG